MVERHGPTATVVAVSHSRTIKACLSYLSVGLNLAEGPKAMTRIKLSNCSINVVDVESSASASERWKVAKILATSVEAEGLPLAAGESGSVTGRPKL